MNLISRSLYLLISIFTGLSLTQCKSSPLHADSANAPQSKQTKSYFIVQERKPEENGAATLATVIRYYNRSENLEIVSSLVVTKDGYASLLSLKQASEKLGFSARGVKVNSCDAILQMNFPAIAHVQTQDKNLGHFVVVFESDQTSVTVGDTTNGIVQKQPRNQFCQTWTRALLLLEPKQPK
jgi:ATP-binding cassette, subfamily C, bacteriocin exporter